VDGDKHNDKSNEERERTVMVDDVRLQVIVAVLYYVMVPDGTKFCSACSFRGRVYKTQTTTEWNRKAWEKKEK
jgi:ligand-binding SRPBCC domain-containing protein